MGRRTRPLPYHFGEGSQVLYSFVCPGAPPGTKLKTGFLPVARRTDSYVTVVGSQVTDSESHPISRLKEPGMVDVGGDFFSQKQYVVGLPSNLRLTTGTRFVDVPTLCQEVTFSGPVWPINPSLLSFPPKTLNVSSRTQLEQLGATAVARAKPDNEVLSLSTLLGELAHEGIPRVSLDTWERVIDVARRDKSVKGLPREAASSYLNKEYGFDPVVSDILKFADGIARVERILTQYERDAGRPVRRRYEFPPSLTTTRTVYSSTADVYLSPYNSGYLGPGFANRNVIRVRSTSQRRWFSGAFVYHLPSDYDSRGMIRKFSSRANQLFGLTLTPEVLWDLAPWSWAVDWFSNIGDVLNNVSARTTDGLVMKYGYLMEHTIIRDTYTRENPEQFKNPESRLDGSISLVTETKQRRRANPFGFGVSWEGLSPFQLSIAAALGISRG